MIPDSEWTRLPSGGRLVTMDSFHYGGSIDEPFLEHTFVLALGLHSLPAMFLPVTSLVNLLSVSFTIMVIQISLLLTRDFIFQPKK